MPVLREQTKTIESCCCTEGPIDVSFQTNKSGYVPGEPIVFDINIQNRSETPVTMLLVDLNQVSIFLFLPQKSPPWSPLKIHTFLLFLFLF